MKWLGPTSTSGRFTCVQSAGRIGLGILGAAGSRRARAPRRIGDRHGGQQLARVRVLRIVEDRGARADLDDLAEIHHRDAVADALDHGHVVRDEEIGEPELRLQVEHQVEHLRLDRHIERRNRLVGDDQLRASASARAMQSRWRWPPENSCGKRRAMSGARPTLRSSSATRSSRFAAWRACAR